MPSAEIVIFKPRPRPPATPGEIATVADLLATVRRCKRLAQPRCRVDVQVAGVSLTWSTTIREVPFQ